MMESNYSNGIERDPARLKENDNDPRKWSNPLEVRLPNAPSMKIYCVYGHGKDTEVNFFSLSFEKLLYLFLTRVVDREHIGKF